MIRPQLYEYLRNNPSDYYMVTWDNHTEPLYFMPYNESFFESPLVVRRYPMNENDLWEYVKEQYIKEYWDEAFETEKKNLIDGYWYEVDCPQCSPFLPFEIDDIYPISEQEYLKIYTDKIKLNKIKNKY